jgi:carboxymethylenebutenolidase
MVEVVSDRIEIAGRDGTFGAYLARPARLPAPAVLVLHEVFGVNADIRKHCGDLAGEGFLAVAPDLFWRIDPGVDLSVTSQPDWEHGVRLYQKFDREGGAKDIKDALDAVTKLAECNSKVALLGYCLGGLMTFLAAQRIEVTAAVAFHGAEPRNT